MTDSLEQTHETDLIGYEFYPGILYICAFTSHDRADESSNDAYIHTHPHLDRNSHSLTDDLADA
jgi:hypothetical protein